MRVMLVVVIDEHEQSIPTAYSQVKQFRLEGSSGSWFFVAFILNVSRGARFSAVRGATPALARFSPSNNLTT